MNRFQEPTGAEEMAAEWCECPCCLQRKHYTEFEMTEAECKECVKEYNDMRKDRE